MKKNHRGTTLFTKEKQELVPLSCPDCGGVLHLENEGAHSFRLFVCQINHRYSGGSLLHAKETQLERTLWSAHVLLKQMLIAYEQTLDEISTADGKMVRRRLNEVRKQCLAVRAMIEATHAVE
jgi:hypothetical protein